MTKRPFAHIILAFILLMVVISNSVTIITAESPHPITLLLSTNGNLSLSSVILNIVAYANNTLYLSGTSSFQAIGYDPALSIDVDAEGYLPNSMSSNVDTNYNVFEVVNGSKNYLINMVNVLPESSTSTYITNGKLVFVLNLADAINKTAQNTFPDNTIQNIGLNGRFNFAFQVNDFVGSIEQKRFFSIVLTGQASVSTIICDFTVPPNADITVAKSNGQEMQKEGVPYRVSTSVNPLPLQPLTGNMYIEWQVPQAAFALFSPPWSYFLSALIGIVCFSIPSKYIMDWLARPKLSLKILQKGYHEPTIHPANGIAFYHLSAENNGKNTATDAEIKLTFRDRNLVELFHLKGKWDSGPEPIGPMVNGQFTPMPSLMPFAERINIRRKMPETFCVAIKDNQAECYAFNCESYFFGFKKPNWQLPIGTYLIDVQIIGGNADFKRTFLLKNTGNTVQDLEIGES
jgi:hypothetical protein